MFLSVMPNLYTADIDAAIAFYRDALGGTETFRTPKEGTPTHIELRIGDVVIALSNRDLVADEVGQTPTNGNPLEFVLWCESTDDAVAKLRSAGAKVLKEPYGGHVSSHRRAYVADPDGNWIALVSPETTG